MTIILFFLIFGNVSCVIIISETFSLVFVVDVRNSMEIMIMSNTFLFVFYVNWNGNGKDVKYRNVSHGLIPARYL